jgi:hypothetical protein
MGHIVIKIEFPCGYKYEADVRTAVFEEAKISSDNFQMKECPLHGKKCRRR